MEGRGCEQGLGGAVFRSEVELAGLVLVVDGLDAIGPGGIFTVVDFTEIEKGLRHGGNASDFHDAPIPVFFAVFQAFVAAKNIIRGDA